MRMEARVLGGLFAAGAIFCSVAEAQLISRRQAMEGPQPTGVTSVSIYASGAGQIYLSWAPVSNATSYKVWGEGLPLTGQDANMGGQIKARYQNPNLSISGLTGPGMGTWSIGAYLDPASGATPTSPATKVSHWITGASGLQQPRMPSPTYSATSMNITEAAWNDREGPVMRTSMPQAEQVAGGCPQSVYFFVDGAAEPILAAGWYVNSTSTQPEAMFTNLNGSMYFRVPKAANITAAPTGNNAYVFAVNCRGEYTNALPFKIWPGDLHIEKAFPVSAVTGGSLKFLGGDNGDITGWGMKNQFATNTQKVILETKFARSDGSQTSTQTQLEVWTEGERTVGIKAPVLTTLAPATSALLDAKVYVVKDGVQSNSIPICYRTEKDVVGMQVMNYGGC